MGLKLSRKIRSVRNFLLEFIKKRSSLIYLIIIVPFSILKFLYKKNKKKIYQKYSEKLDDINKYEFKKTSQNNEDGIIEYIFNKIQLKKINFVEIGFDYYENNSINYLYKVNKGLFIDGSKEKVLKLKSIINLFYPFKNITVLTKFIHKDNLNEIINSYYSEKEEIDFLSIDVDGNDYYLLDNLSLKPKIICVEYNFWFGSNIKCSIPYDKNFIWNQGSLYSGTSLNALCSLAKTKGYHLIALESNCVNAFFVRSDLSHNFNIIDNIKSFKIPKKYSNNEIIKGREYLLNTKLHFFE
jgi:hypothetical protein